LILLAAMIRPVEGTFLAVAEGEVIAVQEFGMKLQLPFERPPLRPLRRSGLIAADGRLGSQQQQPSS
jgi:hypothetical protein